MQNNNSDNIQKAKLKTKLKTALSSKIVICFIVLYAIYLILTSYVDSLESINFIDITHINYAKYYGVIITGIQIILGLIGVLAIFYLGKAHDYKRDFIKYYGQLYETENKIKLTVSSLNRSQFKGMDEWKWHEMKSLGNMVIKDTNDTIKDFEDLGKALSQLPKGVIILSLFILVTFALLFVTVFLNTTTSTPKDFIRTIIAFFFALGELFIIWGGFEHTIKANDVALETTVKRLALLNSVLEKLKSSLQKF